MLTDTEIDALMQARMDRKRKKRLDRRNPALLVIDASTFVRQLERLAITLTYKVEREGYKQVGLAPMNVNISVMLRHLTYTYDLLIYVNADERRDFDPHYRQAYSFVILPLVRTMIDGFYNATALLDDPNRAISFRIGGYYHLRERLLSEEAKFGSNARWRPYLEQERRKFMAGMDDDRLTDKDLDNAKPWPLLGSYLKTKPETPHKQMLRKFTLGFWKEYSSISHTSYDGLIGVYQFIAPDQIPRESREASLDFGEALITTHLGRAAGILLCLLTEIQAFYRFKGASINSRLHEIWRAVNVIPEVKELYAYRYEQLMKSKGIVDTPSDPGEF